MLAVEFPEPPVGIDGLNAEFLLAQQPCIDAVASSHGRLLTGLVIGSLEPNEELTIDKLVERVGDMGVLMESGGRAKFATVIGAILKKEFDPAGLVEFSDGNTSDETSALVRRTEKAKDNLSLIGVFVASRLADDFPVGSFLGKISNNTYALQQPYPYPPTRRLRAAQLMVCHGSVLALDIEQVLQRTNRQVYHLMQDMVGEKTVVAQKDIDGVRYGLAEDVRDPAVKLLCAIASLQDPRYRKKYGAALTLEAQKLSHPKYGPRLAKRLIEGWKRPIDPSTWAERMANRYYPAPEVQEAKLRIEWLVKHGFVKVSASGPSSDSPQKTVVLELDTGLKLQLSPIEQRLFTRGHGVERLVYGDTTELSRQEIATIVHRTGNLTAKEYLHKYLFPKAAAIIRQEKRQT